MLTSRTPARRRRNSTTARRERPICLDFALAPQLRRKWNDSPCNFLSDRALCYLQIILRLQANPEFRRRTEQTREAQRHIRRHGRVTATHQVNAALRDIGVLCYAVARNPHRLNKVLEQYVPGMHRREPPTARDIREVSLPEFVTSNSHGCLVQRDIIAHECGQYPVTMDSLIAAAARALVVGDVLGALKYVSLRDDPPALALRGGGNQGVHGDRVLPTFMRDNISLNEATMAIRRDELRKTDFSDCLLYTSDAADD